MKTCTKCGEKKSLEEFVKRVKSKDNHQYQCKECQRVFHKDYQKAYREKNNNREVVNIPECKYCPVCNIAKLSTQFYKDKGKKDGLHSMCKQCKESRKKKCSK